MDRARYLSVTEVSQGNESLLMLRANTRIIRNIYIIMRIYLNSHHIYLLLSLYFTQTYHKTNQSIKTSLRLGVYDPVYDWSECAIAGGKWHVDERDQIAPEQRVTGSQEESGWYDMQ